MCTKGCCLAAILHELAVRLPVPSIRQPCHQSEQKLSCFHQHSMSPQALQAVLQSEGR